MTSFHLALKYRFLAALALIGLLSGCLPQSASGYIIVTTPTATTAPQRFTPEPTRPAYSPGQLVDYAAQPGDTLISLAAHFNTSADEIRAANPILPAGVTTMPPGMPMKIPIYYEPLWGSAYRILPDSLYPNGPAQVGFDTAEFIAARPGWLNGYREFSFDNMHTAAQIIDHVALQWSVSPRLLLAMLEFHGGGLSQPTAAAGVRVYPLGYRNYAYKGLYLQLIYVANLLNNAYYPYRDGTLDRFDHLDGSEERIDPWQNAATVTLMVFYSHYLDGDNYRYATGPDGLAKTYAGLFGDPWAADQPHIPGSLTQPELRLPFATRETWVYTGGPHTGWGEGAPLAAIDFAPPLVAGGCTPTNEWATAMAGGVVARSEPGLIMLDLDGDGDERTGWVILYLHLAEEGRVGKGALLKVGDPVGHPSCEGGVSTGTHVHIARKYNGEWVSAQGMLDFNLEGWVARCGSAAYLGTLERNGKTVRASTKSVSASHITAGAGE